MEKNTPKTRRGIAFKTSFTSSILILVLLTISSFISVQVQSSFSTAMIEQFKTTQTTALEKDAKEVKASLLDNMNAYLGIFTNIATTHLYNFAQDDLYKEMSGYLKIEGIEAIKVVDAEGQPFGAAWKSPDIQTGDALPGNSSLDESLSFQSDAVYEGEKVGVITFYYTNNSVNNKIKAVEAQTQESIRSFESIAKKNISRSISIQVIVAIVIILALIITLVITLQIFVTRPINESIVMIKDIAQGEGDLTKRLVVKTKDEIGELSDWFNRFIEKLQILIRDATENSRTVDSASTEFTTLSNSMNTSVISLSEKSESVARAAGTMSTNMTSVAGVMEEASANINMVASASEEMSSTINEIARNAEQARAITDNAVTQTNTASDRVNQLGDAAVEIGKVVETITDISEQVNLLALNATIEAARAGEAGKGFAVVANEIKDLANQTASASSAIKEQIDGIQASTSNTVEEIADISKIVEEINTIVSTIATAVEEQSATTKEITENISQVSTGIVEVNENVSEGSTASQQIAREIDEITQASGGLTTSSNKVKTNADELSHLSTKLSDLMGKFKV
jgi:methyl-accepting chemotaxis protein